MKQHGMFILTWIFSILVILLLAACVSQPQQDSTAWGVGAFNSNGERIYFTATSQRGTNITYTGSPSGMMMGVAT